MGAFEVYRDYGPDGAITLERETLNILDGEHRLAMAEARTAGTDRGPGDLIRFQQSLTFDRNVANRTREEMQAFRAACGGLNANPAGFDDPRCVRR